MYLESGPDSSLHTWNLDVEHSVPGMSTRSSSTGDSPSLSSSFFVFFLYTKVQNINLSMLKPSQNGVHQIPISKVYIQTLALRALLNATDLKALRAASRATAISSSDASGM